MSMTIRISRLLGFLTAAFLTTVLLVVGWLLLPALPEPDFLSRKGTLLSATETGEWSVPDGRIREIHLTSSSGLEVDLALRTPSDPLPERPLLIMLSGQETGRKAVELLPDTRGIAVAALSYPFGTIPHRDMVSLMLSLRGIQRGILDTPPAVMLATDYLVNRPGLDPGRVELAGISFGAYIAAVPAALDQRIERLWLIHGSGNPQRVIEAAIRNRVGNEELRQGMAWLLATTASAHHLSPEYWVSRIAPRPLIVVNASDDSTVPSEAVDVLHDALQPPFEILWSPGDHVHPKRPETIAYITELLFERISVPGAVAALH
jgi:hypothetical protein